MQIFTLERDGTLVPNVRISGVEDAMHVFPVGLVLRTPKGRRLLPCARFGGPEVLVNQDRLRLVHHVEFGTHYPEQSLRPGEYAKTHELLFGAKPPTHPGGSTFLIALALRDGETAPDVRVHRAPYRGSEIWARQEPRHTPGAPEESGEQYVDAGEPEHLLYVNLADTMRFTWPDGDRPDWIVRGPIMGETEPSVETYAVYEENERQHDDEINREMTAGMSLAGDTGAETKHS